MRPVSRRPWLLLAAAGLVALAGCGSIEPWVKPYEREHLADPIMSLDPNPVSSAYMDHVFEVREGARGATGGSGGGCGCT
jgi:DNA primase